MAIIKSPVASKKEGIQRISISLKKSIFKALDTLVKQRGFENRSQAVAEMINQAVIDFNKECDDQIMAGTITLFYDEAKVGLLEQLSAIQRRHIAEVISSQRVLLENDHTMEVLIVQGPAKKLQKITDSMITCKGVKSGRLALTSTIIPQLHSKKRK